MAGSACIRRYYTTLQRVRNGDVVIGHVPDVENPADFLTKHVGPKKYRASVQFATNRAAWSATK